MAGECGSTHYYRLVERESFNVRWSLQGLGEAHRGVAQAMLRRECRGLVVGSEGIAARPLHKFFSCGQVPDLKYHQLKTCKVVEVTEKLDGVMAFGVVLDGSVELWTRGGFGAEAKSITRWAEAFGSKPDSGYLGLIRELDDEGCTATFEWVGKQARVKVNEIKTRLVLLQIRDKEGGGYWGWEERGALAKKYGIEVVREVARWRDRQFVDVHNHVRSLGADAQQEGYVIRLEMEGGGDMLVKAKTKWWLEQENHRYLRWWGVEHREFERSREAKKVVCFQKQELGMVVRGWSNDEAPAGLFKVLSGVQKVEAFYTRNEGKRGAIVVSFETKAEKVEARRIYEMRQGGEGIGGTALIFGNAYSSRSSSNAHHRVRTWHASTY